MHVLPSGTKALLNLTVVPLQTPVSLSPSVVARGPPPHQLRDAKLALM